MAGDVRDTDRYRRVGALVQSSSNRFRPAACLPGRRGVARRAVRGCHRRHVRTARGSPVVHAVDRDADGRRSWTVTTAAGDAADPRWSPDGRSLSFLADHHDRHRHAPWVVDVGEDGPAGEPRRLACPPGIAEHHRWSPTGAGSCSSWPGAGRAGRRPRVRHGRAGRCGRRSTDVGPGGRDIPWPRTSGGRRGPWTRPPARSGACRRRGSTSGRPPGWAMTAWWRSCRMSRRRTRGTGARVVRRHVARRHDRGRRGAVDPGVAARPGGGAPDGRRAAVIEGVASDRYFVAGALVDPRCAAGGAVTVDTPGVDVSSARWLDGERLLALGVSGMETVGLAIDLRDGRGPRDLPDTGGRRLPGSDGLARGDRRRLRDAPGRPGGSESGRRRPRGP